VLLSILAIVFVNPGAPRIDKSVGLSAPEVDFRRKVRELVGVAISKDQKAHRDFRAALAKIISSYERQFAEIAEAVSRAGSDYEAIATMLYYMAWDQVRSDTRADAYLAGKLGPIVDPVTAAFGREISSELARFETELKKYSVQLAVDLAELGTNGAEAPPRMDSQADLNSAFKKATAGLAVEAAAHGSFLAVDGYRLGKSRAGTAFIRRIAGVSARTFGSQIAKLVGSAGLAAADGPLPVFDIVAAVGFIWSAYEVSQIQPQFKADLYMLTKGQLDEMRSELNMRASTFGDEAISKYQVIQRSMGERSVAALSMQGEKK
jgi:hypothetical protein